MLYFAVVGCLLFEGCCDGVIVVCCVLCDDFWCVLFVVGCLVFDARCALFAVGCKRVVCCLVCVLLCVAGCSVLCAVCYLGVSWLLFNARYLLSVVCCLLCVGLMLLFVV